MMGIMVSVTCWASNKICNKNHLLHIVGILFPHTFRPVIGWYTKHIANFIYVFIYSMQLHNKKHFLSMLFLYQHRAARYSDVLQKRRVCSDVVQWARVWQDSIFGFKTKFKGPVIHQYEILKQIRMKRRITASHNTVLNTVPFFNSVLITVEKAKYSTHIKGQKLSANHKTWIRTEMWSVRIWEDGHACTQHGTEDYIRKYDIQNGRGKSKTRCMEKNKN